MKRFEFIRRGALALLVATPLVLFSVGAVPGTVAPTKLGPRLEMMSLVCDFGTSRVQELDGEFTFRNAGDEPLELGKPGTSCGCTVAQLSSSVVLPGEAGRLMFHLSLPNTLQGVVEKHLYLPSNDTRQPNLTLTARVVVVPLFELEPLQVTFDELRQGMVTNAVVRVQRTDGGSLAAMELRPSAKFITARFEPSTSGSTNAGTIALRLTAEGEPRWLYERVALWPRGATQEVANISVYGRILGEVVLSRDEIYWAVLDRKHPGVRIIRARLSNQNETLKITNLQCTLKDAKLSLQQTSDGRGCEITVELLRVSDALTKGVITFDTNAPHQPKMTVPITINLLRQ